MCSSSSPKDDLPSLCFSKSRFELPDSIKRAWTEVDPNEQPTQEVRTKPTAPDMQLNIESRQVACTSVQTSSVCAHINNRHSTTRFVGRILHPMEPGVCSKTERHVQVKMKKNQ